MHTHHSSVSDEGPHNMDVTLLGSIAEGTHPIFTSQTHVGTKLQQQRHHVTVALATSHAQQWRPLQEVCACVWVGTRQKQ